MDNQTTQDKTGNAEIPLITSKANRLAMEMRTPLTAIGLSVEMLEEEIKDEELRQYLEIINRSTEKITDLINEMLKSPAHLGNGL